MFDTFIASYHRVGTVALCRYLSLHREIYCPGYMGRFFHAVPPEEKSRSQAMQTKRKVLIWHDTELSLLENPALPLLKNRLILPIRHPVNFWSSIYNQEVEAHLFGTGDKPAGFSNYLAKQNLTKANAVAWGSQLLNKFNTTQVIDFFELGTDQVAQTMKRIYRWLDVDDDFTSPQFYTQQVSQLDRFVDNVSVNLTHSTGKSIPIRFGRKATFNNQFFPLFSLEHHATLSQKLENFEVLCGIPIDTLEHGSASSLRWIDREIEKRSESLALQFSDQLNHLLKRYNEMKANIPDKSFIDSINKRLMPFYHHIFQINPNIESLWRQHQLL